MSGFWPVGVIVLGAAAGAVAIAWTVFWLAFDPLCHPFDCHCRRCDWYARSRARKEARLAKAGQR